MKIKTLTNIMFLLQDQATHAEEAYDDACDWYDDERRKHPEVEAGAEVESVSMAERARTRAREAMTTAREALEDFLAHDWH